MATLRTYRCECGYEVQTEPTGHYGLFAGEFYNFRCANCKKKLFPFLLTILQARDIFPNVLIVEPRMKKYITGTLSKGVALSAARKCMKFQE